MVSLKKIRKKVAVVPEEIDIKESAFISNASLARSLNLFQGVSIVVGILVGAGIYITPQDVLSHVKSPGLSLVFWALAGLFSILGAFCYVEIGVRYPIAGEKYAYLQTLYGSFYAFVFIWQCLLLLRPGSNAIRALTIGRYLLKPFFLDCEVPRPAILLISSVFALSICLLNSVSVKLTARCQGFMVFITLSTLVLLSGIGIHKLLTHDNLEILEQMFDGSSTNLGDLMLGFYSAVFALYGWSALNFLVEELKDPYKTLPRAILISIITVSTLFILVNLSYFLVLGKDGVLKSEAVAISVAMKTFGNAGMIMSVVIATTACSGFNSGILVGSRLALAGARNGHLPWIMSLISIKFVTPVTSILFQCILTLVYVWAMDISEILSNVMFSYFVFDFLVVVGYMVVRLNDTSSSGLQIKVPLVFHLCYSLVLLFLIVVPLASNHLALATGFLAIFTASTVSYVLFVLCKTTSDWASRRLGMISCGRGTKGAELKK